MNNDTFWIKFFIDFFNSVNKFARKRNTNMKKFGIEVFIVFKFLLIHQFWVDVIPYGIGRFRKESQNGLPNFAQTYNKIFSFQIIITQYMRYYA